MAGVSLLGSCADAQRTAASFPENFETRPQTYSVERWTAEEGLPNNSLSSLMYSRDGYLWIGGLAGSERFDGVRFSPTLDSLPNAHIRALLEDHRGVIWVGLVNAGLAQYHDRRTEVLPPERIAGADVRALAEDSEGRIWAGTDHGLSVIDAAGGITNVRMEQGLAGNAISSLARGADGNIWIATNGGVCRGRYRPAGSVELQCRAADNVFGDPASIGKAHESMIPGGVLIEGREGTLWAGGAKGLLSLHADLSPATPCATICFPDRTVSALLQLRGGGLLAGFADGGLILLDHGVAEQYTNGDGLVAAPVVALTEDAEGSVWVGAYNGGLERLRPKRVRMYTTADGLPAKPVGSIVQDARGTIWAGTQCGPVSELRGGRFLPRFLEYTKSACAMALWASRDGSLWIGTDQGLFRWHDNRMDHLGRAEGLSDTDIRALIEDRDGVLWIGTLLGGLHAWSNGRLSRSFGPADGVSTGGIDNFAEDRSGRLWIASNGNGLSVRENGRFRILSAAEQPPDRDISGLFVDSRDDLWIMTDHSGVFRRRHDWKPGDKLDVFGPDQGLGDRLVALMLEDRGGTLWAAHARGISRLERDSIEAVAAGRRASLDPIILDRGDGLVNLEVSGGGFDPTGLRDRDGRLWFSTIDGIAVVDPATFPMNRVQPRVVIETAKIGGGIAAQAGESISLPAGGPSVELGYTALSLLAPRKVRFRYRLRGFGDWEDAGNRRTAYYPHLPPGSYTFELVAANNDGVWNRATAEVPITVAPFWWERSWVYGSGLMLLLLSTTFAARTLSLRRAAARVAELERETALDRERSRIARDIHDDLGSRLTRMALIADDPSLGMGADLAAAAREAIQAMDELVWTVNTRNDTLDSFITYAVAYSEDYLHRAKIRLRIRTPEEALGGKLDSGKLDSGKLDSNLRRQLFLAYKEALNNVVKHSHASEVHLHFAVAARELSIEIRDNGCGFDIEAADPTRNGLSGMRERIAAAGGRCDISSSGGVGTTVHIHAPYWNGSL